MHNAPGSFSALAVGSPVGPMRITISAAANERYWTTVGADHPALRAGALYPPIAANLTVLTFQQICPEPVIQTRQRLVCHRLVSAETELVVEGAVTARYEKRDRDYVDLTVTVRAADADDPVWTSEVTFTPVSTPGRRAS